MGAPCVAQIVHAQQIALESEDEVPAEVVTLERDQGLSLKAFLRHVQPHQRTGVGVPASACHEVQYVVGAHDHGTRNSAVISKSVIFPNHGPRRIGSGLPVQAGLAVTHTHGGTRHSLEIECPTSRVGGTTLRQHACATGNGVQAQQRHTGQLIAASELGQLDNHVVGAIAHRRVKPVVHRKFPVSRARPRTRPAPA